MIAAALLALTAMVLGFAHRPVELEPRGYGVAVVAYLLPDGSLPDLCLYDEDGGHAADHRRPGDRVAGSCDACRLSDAPGLAVLPTILADLPPPGGEVRPDRWGDLIADGAAVFAPSARGPPTA